MMMNNNKLLFAALLLVAATANTVSGADVICCQACSMIPGFFLGDACYGFGLEDDGSDVPAVTGPSVTDEICTNLGFAMYRDTDGTCIMTGNAPNGDCYKNSDCTGDIVMRQTLDSCEDLNYGSLQDYYNPDPDTQERMCYSVEMLRDMFPKSATTEGDPHVKTWGGKWFDYHGECDLVMINAPNFEKDTPLRVHVRTTIRYDYSFIEAAAIKLGDDVLEVSSYGNYAWNGISHVDLKDATLELYPIHYEKKSEKHHVFDIVLSPKENITISTFKDLVSVKITAADLHHFRSTHGLMGSYSGTMYARDGVTVMSEDDPNAFGQEWQVRSEEPMLFSYPREPQASAGQKCKLPSADVIASQAAKRRLGSPAQSKAAQMACAHLKGVQKRNCVDDVLALGDTKLAGDY